MPLDLTALNQAIADDTAQVAQTTTVEAGATTLINGIGAAMNEAVTTAVTAALEKAGIENQAIVDAATTAISGVTAQYAASSKPLADAILARTPSA